MSINDAIGQAIGYMRLAILFILLMMIVVVLINQLGVVRIDFIKPPSPETLAYLAGAFWLTGGKK